LLGERRRHLKFFHRKSRAIKNWHNRALLIDFKKTRLTIIQDGLEEKTVPAWAYKKFITVQEEA
jgi:hypothetical protein